MKHKGTKVATKLAPLRYVFITGEGRNQALPGQPERMQYVASVVVKKDSPEHKHFQSLIMKEWNSYKAKFGVKGLPKTTGMRPVYMDDPSGTIDPATDEVRKIETDEILITFKTNITWPDGKPQVVKVFDGTKQNLTKAIHNLAKAEPAKTIGNGSMGIIHGLAMGNNVGGTQKVSLYLQAIQVATIEWYEGSDVSVDEIASASAIQMPIEADEDLQNAIGSNDEPDI